MTKKELEAAMALQAEQIALLTSLVQAQLEKGAQEDDLSDLSPVQRNQALSLMPNHHAYVAGLRRTQHDIPVVKLDTVPEASTKHLRDTSIPGGCGAMDDEGYRNL